jgi:glycosyltransferase involved in cell wall biosynthesis
MKQPDSSRPEIAVIIPCYRVAHHICEVLAGIGPEVSGIYAVDDCCPENTGVLITERVKDPRVKVLWAPRNLGVGGATMLGYQAALADGKDILIKVDGDGQMDPALIPELIAPICEGKADYVKGNRFFYPEDLEKMPPVRLLGNAALSFMNKLSSGYWHLFDPTNGYTALAASVAAHLPFEKISKRYFFESDILFRLNLLRAVVRDFPMTARYADEVSNLRILRIIPGFLLGHLRNLCKRIFYNYYLRDWSPASIELPLGLASLLMGGSFGTFGWRHQNARHGGTVMLSAHPSSRVQLTPAFLSFDIQSVPRHSSQRRS